MTKRQATYLAWRKELSKTDWNVRKTDSVEFNSGSETAKHLFAKTATAKVLKANGYRVDSEVAHPERGEIDVVAIPAQEEQKPFAVELEHSPTEATVNDKLDRYYYGTPFVECYIINLNEVPESVIEMTGYIAQELGLEP